MSKLFVNNPPDKQMNLSKTVPPKVTKPQPLSYHVANLQGIGSRERQEDAFAFGNALDGEAIAKKGLLVVVADGMGGMQGGKIASELVTATLLKQYESFDMTGDVAKALQEAVFEANDYVYDELSGLGGSTVVAGLILSENLYFTSVGDSYLMLLHDRKLIRLNKSQNVLNRDYLDAICVGQMDPFSPRQNPEKEAITQFLGMPELEETDGFVRPLKLVPGDVLLFCSDGVAGVLSTECMERCLSFGHPVDMCAALEAEIKKRALKYQDNYTALIVQCVV